MVIYVDGSAKPNPGKGGYSVIVMDGDKVLDAYCHYEDNTTNNRQELKAILYTLIRWGTKLSDLTWCDSIPVVYSDSAYSVQTYNDWMFRWERNGWCKADGQIPENLDLIQEYFNLYQKGYRIDLRKIKGHAGHLGNELADKLATKEMTIEEVMNYGRK